MIFDHWAIFYFIQNIHEFYELKSLKSNSLNLGAKSDSRSFNSRVLWLIRVQNVQVSVLSKGYFQRLGQGARIAEARGRWQWWALRKALSYIQGGDMTGQLPRAV